MSDPTNQDLLREIHNLKVRLAELERTVQSRSSQSAPPPVQQQPKSTLERLSEVVDHDRALQQEVPKFNRTASGVQDPPKPKQPATTKAEGMDDTEFAIGAKLLPWLGAGIVIIGLIWLVTWAVQEGLITPPMRFVGSLILGFGLAIGGHFTQKKNALVASLLTGLGSAALFMAFAAGGTTWQIYPQNTIVPIFVGLAALNVAYGSWQNNKTFVGLGLIGTLTAFGLAIENAGVSLGIAALSYLIILIVSSLKDWRDFRAINWVATIGMVLVVWGNHFNKIETITLTAVGFTLVLALVNCYDAVRRKEEEAPFLAILIGFFAFGMAMVKYYPTETIPALVGMAYTGIGFALAHHIKSRAITATTWFFGVVYCGILNLGSTETDWVYLIGYWALLMVASYLVTLEVTPEIEGQQSEKGEDIVAFIGLAALGPVLIAFGLNNQPVPSIFAAVIALSLLAIPRFTTHLPKVKPAIWVISAFLLGTVFPLALPAEAEIYAYYAIAVLVTIAAFRVKNEVDWTAIAWYHMGILTYCYIFLAYPDNGYTFNIPEPVVLFACAALLAALIYRSTRDDRREKKAVTELTVTCGTALGLALLTRGVYLMGDLPGTEWSGFPLTVAWALYAIALLVGGFVTKLPMARFYGFTGLAVVSGKLLLLDLENTSVGYRVGVAIVLGLVMIGLSYVLYLRPKSAPSNG